jgi:hypothetical protein
MAGGMGVEQGALRLAREGSAAALRAKPGGGPGIPRFFFAGRTAVLRHRFLLAEKSFCGIDFFLAGRTSKKMLYGCENPSSLRKKLSGIELRTFCTRSRNPTSRPTGHDDTVSIRLEPRMFCTRSKNHTSRPTGHDDAICAVFQARREFLVIIHLMPHQASSSKAQQSPSKKSEFKRKLGALNQIRTTDVLHPKQESYL